MFQKRKPDHTVEKERDDLRGACGDHRCVTTRGKRPFSVALLAEEESI
jgi:hypothetical protein